MFEVILTNIGNKIYEGNFRIEALYKAEFSGFESTVLKDNNLYASFSPISGWKFFS